MSGKRCVYSRHGALSGARGGAAGGTVLILAYYAAEQLTHQRTSLAGAVLDWLTLVVWIPVYAIIGAAVGATAGAAAGFLIAARARALTLWAIALPVSIPVCVYVVRLMLQLANASPTGPVTSPSINLEAAVIGTISGFVASSVAIRRFLVITARDPRV